MRPISGKRPKFRSTKISETTEIAEIDRNFGNISASETSKLCQIFSKLLTETDRNVSRNFAKFRWLRNFGANPTYIIKVDVGSPTSGGRGPQPCNKVSGRHKQIYVVIWNVYTKICFFPFGRYGIRHLNFDCFSAKDLTDELLSVI